VYLAGFEVFFTREKELEISDAKREICRKWGLEGVFPGDVQVPEGLSDGERAKEIYRKDLELMDGCDAIAANLTPFRGLSADTGTCWELGYFVGAGKPAVAYTNEIRSYEARVPRSMKHARIPGLDSLGMRVDMQEEPDNCMMTRSVSYLALPSRSIGERAQLTDLESFEACVRRLSEFYSRGALLGPPTHA
jgi:nucleoside 2-deoxyribosyltransferase